MMMFQFCATKSKYSSEIKIMKK